MTLTASLGPTLYPIERAHSPVLMVREGGLPASPQPRLLDRVRDGIRARHNSRRAEKAYVHWIYTHVLNRGPAGVQSPADRIFGP